MTYLDCWQPVTDGCIVQRRAVNVVSTVYIQSYMYKQISSKDTEKGAHPEDPRRPEDPAEQNAGKITNCLKLVFNYSPPLFSHA